MKNRWLVDTFRYKERTSKVFDNKAEAVEFYLDQKIRTEKDKRARVNIYRVTPRNVFMPETEMF